MSAVVLKPSPAGQGMYFWDCPECKSGGFTWSESINAQWGYPPNKAVCAVCGTSHDIEKAEK